MITAIIGLVGVVVGALVTGGIEYLLAHREDKYERRAALRLVCTDFYKVISVTKEVASDGEWGPERTSLPHDAYEKHAGTLARTLDAATWKRIEGSILGVKRLDGIRSEMFEEARAASPSEIADFRRIRGFIQRTLSSIDNEAWAIERDRSSGDAGTA